MKGIIPLTAMEKILKEKGARRVSEEAKQELYETVVLKAQELSKKAKVLAEHAGRQTIKAKDVELAFKENL